MNKHTTSQLPGLRLWTQNTLAAHSHGTEYNIIYCVLTEVVAMLCHEKPKIYIYYLFNEYF